MGLLREMKVEFSYLTLALGAFLTMLVIFNYFLTSVLPLFITDIVNAVGNWIIWFVLLGPLLVLIGGWYFVDTIRKQREFRRLLKVPSKARFVRNQERLEELTWYLSADYRRNLAERKKHWNIKK